MASLLSVFNLRRDFALKVIAWLLVLSSITGGILLPQSFYFFALGLLGILIVSRGQLRFSNAWIILLLLACLLSIVVNRPPSYFNAWGRYIVYLLVVAVVSPMLFSESALKMRFKVLQYFTYIGVILSIGSFFAYFFGINLFERQGELLEIGAGTFSGLMNHSMVLGPISALSAILLFSYTLSYRHSMKRGKRVLMITMMALCCGACLLAASRIALSGLVVGLLVVVIASFRETPSKAFRIVFFVIIIGVATYPIWGKLTTYVIEKQEGNYDRGSAFFSREDKFEARIYEFKSSPIFGIGFCVADPQFSGVNATNGRVEPGSSWLAVASMTGILGLLAFLPLCIIASIKVWRIRDPLVRSLLAGMLFFFYIHMIAEGYIYAPKSCFSLLFWLILASIFGFSILEKRDKTFRYS